MDPHTLARNVNSIFSLPDVALRVSELMNSGEATNAELEHIILHDPALTAKILKFVNSACFGLPGKVETVSRAILLIGHQDLHNLVIATSVTSTFKGISSSLVDMETFWYHSITCGIVARLFAINLNSRERERFFIAGLLHRIGKLIFFSQYPEESAKVLSFKDQGDDAVTDAERDVFGFTYAELGAEFLKQWQLPPRIWKMIELQIDPLSNEEFKEAACILHAAASIANCIQPYANRAIHFDEIKATCKPEVWHYLDLTPGVIELIIDETGMQVFEILAVIKPEALMKF
ncbi:MAG: HDOD domain-containing protein [Nitrosomonas sp.]|nr:HDOD domain-containing protein [Nitrosomonas sp.]MDP1951547.1 HDOD domain-containing protein [Nitrosomonas sp.]